MAKKNNISIIKKHLIICEGEDAYRFLIPYLNSPELSDHKEFSNDIQVLNFGGNEELTNYLGVLLNSEGFDLVESLLIIRDAEKNSNTAIAQIKSSLSKVGLPVPSTPHEWLSNEKITIGFLLFPVLDHQATEGTLEDLCISILSEPKHAPILNAIDSFLQELKSSHEREFPHEFKTKLHTYFSITDRYVSLKIGEAANAGAFDWSNGKINKLKDFMLEIF